MLRQILNAVAAHATVFTATIAVAVVVSGHMNRPHHREPSATCPVCTRDRERIEADHAVREAPRS